jgi:TATA-binding protein-associated factor Taf7
LSSHRFLPLFLKIPKTETEEMLCRERHHLTETTNRLLREREVDQVPKLL